MAADNSARLLVCTRPGKAREQFLLSSMLKNTPQPALLNLESWLQTHAPSVQAATQSWFWVSLSNLASDKTLSGKVSQRIDCAHALAPLSAQATDSRSSRKIPHLEVNGALVSRGEPFPSEGTSRAYALQLQVPHHKKETEGISLSGSQTASLVSKHSHKGAHGDRFVVRENSWYCS